MAATRDDERMFLICRETRVMKPASNSQESVTIEDRIQLPTDCCSECLSLVLDKTSQFDMLHFGHIQ